MGDKGDRECNGLTKSVTVLVEIVREDQEKARTFNCCICGQPTRGKATVYYAKVNGEVKLTFKACPQHAPDLEERMCPLEEAIEEDLSGYLEKDAIRFLSVQCIR